MFRKYNNLPEKTPLGEIHNFSEFCRTKKNTKMRTVRMLQHFSGGLDSQGKRFFQHLDFFPGGFFELRKSSDI